MIRKKCVLNEITVCLCTGAAPYSSMLCIDKRLGSSSKSEPNTLYSFDSYRFYWRSVCLSLVSLHRKQLCCKTCGADIPDDLPVSGRERERPQWCSIRWIIIFWSCRKSTYLSIPSNIAPSAFYLYDLYFSFYNVRHFISLSLYPYLVTLFTLKLFLCLCIPYVISIKWFDREWLTGQIYFSTIYGVITSKRFQRFLNEILHFCDRMQWEVTHVTHPRIRRCEISLFCCCSSIAVICYDAIPIFYCQSEINRQCQCYVYYVSSTLRFPI